MQNLELILTGRTETHLIPLALARVHEGIRQDIEAITLAASKAGFEFYICSSFRSFEQQVKIWNEKANGTRPMIDDQGRILSPKGLSEEELMFAILRWSALPGASRHHWGTDVDVYDKLSKPSDYDVKLVPAEYTNGGIFSAFNLWLNENIEEFGFFRPYAKDRGGVHPEPWHISHLEQAQYLLDCYEIDMLERAISASDLALKDTVLKNLDLIYDRFVININ